MYFSPGYFFCRLTLSKTPLARILTGATVDIIDSD